jgi:hypothetical protein
LPQVAALTVARASGFQNFRTDATLRRPRLQAGSSRLTPVVEWLDDSLPGETATVGPPRSALCLELFLPDPYGVDNREALEGAAEDVVVLGRLGGAAELASAVDD